MSVIDEIKLEGVGDLPWQMSWCERFTLHSIVRILQPAVSVEVGTYRGGSLQVLSHYSQAVESLDIDPTVGTRLAAQFHNVTFHAGNSHELLPTVLRRNANAGRDVGFVLVDGDHSADGVRRDLEAILSVPPSCRQIMLMHDSFNPACRSGIQAADWGSCPYVHSVDLDFVPGIFHADATDTAQPRSMWGGFACAVRLPVPRRNALVIQAHQQLLLGVVYRKSSHYRPLWRKVVSRARRAAATWPVVR